MSSKKKKKLEVALDNLFSSAQRPAQPMAPKPAAKAVKSSSPTVTIIPVVEAETQSSAPSTPAVQTPEATLPPQPPAPVIPLSPFASALASAAVKTIPSPQTQPKPSAAGPTLPTKAAASVKEDHHQLVVFSLAGELYGLDIAVVESIIKMQAITQLPHVPAYIKGVTNLRGSVLPVVDLRTRFNLEAKEATRQTRIIVVTMDNIKVGMVVDGVSEVLQVSNELIEPLPQMVNSVNSAFLKGIVRLDDRLIILPDLGRVLSTDEKAGLQALPAAGRC